MDIKIEKQVLKQYVLVPKNWTDKKVKYNYKMRNGKDPQRSKAKANR